MIGLQDAASTLEAKYLIPASDNVVGDFEEEMGLESDGESGSSAMVMRRVRIEVL